MEREGGGREGGRALVALVALRRAVDSCALSLPARELVRRFPPVSSFDDHDKERRARESRSKGSSACFLGDEGALSRRCSLDSTLFALSTLRSVQHVIPCESESSSSSVTSEKSALELPRSLSFAAARSRRHMQSSQQRVGRATSPSPRARASSENELAEGAAKRSHETGGSSAQNSRSTRTSSSSTSTYLHSSRSCTLADPVRYLYASCTLAVR